ncbi:MAG: hypothetical protein Q4A96_03975, partial [Candidatus Saccharibacteria bacterium]|nr:hypothetical protein [Candidatus Saccharibacteria bacterium]
ERLSTSGAEANEEVTVEESLQEKGDSLRISHEYSREEVEDLCTEFADTYDFGSQEKKDEFLEQSGRLIAGELPDGSKSEHGVQLVADLISFTQVINDEYGAPDDNFVDFIDSCSKSLEDNTHLVGPGVDPYLATRAMWSGVRKVVSELESRESLETSDLLDINNGEGRLEACVGLVTGTMEAYLGSHAVTNEELLTIMERFPDRTFDRGEDPVYRYSLERSFRAPERGMWSFGTFEVGCLAKSATASNICLLMEAYSELPGSNKSDFLQSRVDAIAIESAKLVPSRDFIHNEYPGSHNLVVAMLNYYDGMKDLESGQFDDDERAEKEKELREKLESVLEKCRSITPDGYDGFESTIFDISRYDSMYEFGDYDIEQGGGSAELASKAGDEMSAIDILRRIERCTGGSFSAPPVSGVEYYPQCGGDNVGKDGQPRLSIDELASAVFDTLAQKTNNDGTIEASEDVDLRSAEFRRFMTGINEYLMENNGKAVLTPELIALLSWVSDLAKYSLRSLPDREVSQLPYDPAFKEIVRFNELTMGDGYNYQSFESFWQSFERTPYVSAANETGVSENPAVLQAMTDLQTRELGRARAQMRIYDSQRRAEDAIHEKRAAAYRYDPESSKMGTKRYFDRAKKMVNSGNLEHELEVLRERVE